MSRENAVARRQGIRIEAGLGPSARHRAIKGLQELALIQAFKTVNEPGGVGC